LLRCCTKCSRDFPATTEFFHIVDRKISATTLRGDCVECFRTRLRLRYATSEKARSDLTASTRRRRARADVKEKERIYAREKKRKDRSTEEGAARLRDYVRTWRAANPEKYERYKTTTYKGVTPKVLAKNRTRDLRKTRATPPWVELSLITPFYEYAAALTKQTGIRYSVDHIMPLKGKDSSGLHVPWNLQVIPLADNIKKGNRLCQM